MTELPAVVREAFTAVDLGIASWEVVRDFPWSCLIRLTTTDGATVWAKRCGEGMAFEPDLTRVIESVGSPILVPTLWISGRWIATADAAGSLGRGDLRTIAAVHQLQRPLADLQQRLASRMEEVRSARVPSLSADDVDDLVDRSIRLCAGYRHLATRPLQASEERAIRGAKPRLTASLQMLDANAPTTLLHLDLHHGNVFEHDGDARLFDWGDARIGSAYLHVMSTVSLLGFITDLDSRDARIEAVVEAYVSAWPDLVVSDEALAIVHDPRMAAFVRLDALTAALGGGSDEAIAPFANWLPDLIRAAGAADPADARGVRLA